jgi:hypothetical protein
VRTRTLLRCGAVSGPAFCATFVVLGRSQRAYDPRRQAISDLARSQLAPFQVLNFLVSGALTIAGAVGVRRALRPGACSAALPACVAAVGAGKIAAGIFATDTEEEMAAAGHLSRRGALHVASAVPVFVCMPLAAAFGARRMAADGRRGRAALSLACGITSITAAAATGATMDPDHPRAGRSGTFQRIAVVSGLGWLSLLCHWLSAGA